MAGTYYTVEQANAKLPALRQVIADLRAIRSRFASKYRELAILRRQGVQLQGDEDPFFRLECELEFMQLEAEAMGQRLADQSIQLKDLESGLIDFPAKLDGREVLLCWKEDEEQVEHYHGLEDGFRGRRRLTGFERFG